MDPTSGFLIEKPVSVLNKPLKANFKDIFKALGKAVVDGTTGNWSASAKDLTDAASAVGLDDSAEQIAWRLIVNALSQAVFALVDEQQDCFLHPPDQKALEKICDELDWSLENKGVRIDRHFFENPGNLSVIEDVQKTLEEWLVNGFSMNQAQAKSMAGRLPAYFVFALNDAWRRSPAGIEKLKTAVETPFTKADERERGWLHYMAWLKKQADEQVFGETFSLRQIYIPLRAYFEKKADDDREEIMSRDFEPKKERIVVDLQSELEKWIQARDRDDAVRVISGGPGSGKSSFAKMFAARQAENNEPRILFIPLHQLEISDDLVEAVGKYVRYDPFFSHNPLDPDPNIGERRLLVIFDGLDELAMQGTVGAETAQRIVSHVKEQVFRFNMRETRLQVIVSGRDVPVQSVLNEFRRPGQILPRLRT